MSKEVVVVAKLEKIAGGAWRATVRPTRTNQSDAMRHGEGPSEERAIAKAMGRPLLSFETASDELEAVIAAARGRPLTVMATQKGFLRSLGMR